MNAFVLAGGQSSRMGRDKAMLAWRGRPLIAHALDLLRSLGYSVRIAGSRPDLAEFAPVVADEFSLCGPLGGIEAALNASDAKLNLFVPIDLPLLPAEFLRWMVERAERTGAAATMPRVAGRVQPLCAVYARSLRDGLRESLAAGEFKVMRAVERAADANGKRAGGCDVFDMEAIAALLPAGVWPVELPVAQWFRNLNTPEELAASLAPFGGRPVDTGFGEDV